MGTLTLKSLHLSLKLILSGLILLNLTLRLPYLLLHLKRIIYWRVLGRGYHKHRFPLGSSGHVQPGLSRVITLSG